MTQARRTGWRELASGYRSDILGPAGQAAPRVTRPKRHGRVRGTRRQRVPAAIAESSQP